MWTVIATFFAQLMQGTKHQESPGGFCYFSGPMEIRFEKVRKYILSPATAGVAWLLSPKGLTASNSYAEAALITTTSPSVVIQ